MGIIDQYLPVAAKAKFKGCSENSRSGLLFCCGEYSVSVVCFY